MLARVAARRGRATAGGVLLALGIAVVALAVECFFRASAWERRFEKWLAAEPSRFEVDVSRPGTYHAPLVQTCAIAHAEVFELIVQGPVSDDQLDQGLDELRARLVVTGPDGDEVVTQEYPAEAMVFGPTRQHPMLFRIVPFSEGPYHVALTIDRGASTLAGLRQQVVARYELCGLERLPAAMYQVTGVLVGAVGAVLFAVGIGVIVPPPE